MGELSLKICLTLYFTKHFITISVQVTKESSASSPDTIVFFPFLIYYRISHRLSSVCKSVLHHKCWNRLRSPPPTQCPLASGWNHAVDASLSHDYLCAIQTSKGQWGSRSDQREVLLGLVVCLLCRRNTGGRWRGAVALAAWLYGCALREGAFTRILKHLLDFIQAFAQRRSVPPERYKQGHGKPPTYSQALRI